MNDRESHPWRLSLGAYLLTALEPDESEEMHRHLETCIDCRAVCADLKPVIEAMDRVPMEAFVADDALANGIAALRVRPSEELWERLRARASLATADVPQAFPERMTAAKTAYRARALASAATIAPSASVRPLSRGPRWKRSLLHPLTATVVSCLLVVAAAVGAYSGFHQSSQPSGTETVSATNSATGVSATLSYRTESSASWVQITVKGVAPHTNCTLFGLSSNGERAVGGSWWTPSAPYGSATYSSIVSMQLSDIRSFQVVDNAGVILLKIPNS